ncbi:MAG TPA: hypothetical protein VIX42_10080 [Edaphobacter sp.]
MKLCRPLVAVLFALIFVSGAVFSAGAQVAVYAGFSGAPVNGSGATSSAFGPMFGLYAQSGSHISIGGDVRGSFLTRNAFNFFTAAAGPRIAVRPPILPIRPYVEGLVGVANFKDGNGSSSNTKLNYQVLGGIDATILPHVDWRVIEFDYSAVSGDSVNAKIFSTGLVLRL